MESQPYEELSDFDRRVVDDIREHGWHGVWVPEDDVGPGFNFSVGLMETLDHPEIIIFGLDAALMHDLMWGMVHEIESGRRFDEPGFYEDVIEGCPCAIREVHETQHEAYFGYALWYLRWSGSDRALQAVQMFWPSKTERLFPWDDGCPSVVAELQPMLYLPVDDDDKM